MVGSTSETEELLAKQIEEMKTSLIESENDT